MTLGGVELCPCPLDNADGPDEDDGEEEEVGQRVREDRGGEGELGHEAVDELDHLGTGVQHG